MPAHAKARGKAAKAKAKVRIAKGKGNGKAIVPFKGLKTRVLKRPAGAPMKRRSPCETGKAPRHRHGEDADVCPACLGWKHRHTKDHRCWWVPASERKKCDERTQALVEAGKAPLMMTKSGKPRSANAHRTARHRAFCKRMAQKQARHLEDARKKWQKAAMKAAKDAFSGALPSEVQSSGSEPQKALKDASPTRSIADAPEADAAEGAPERPSRRRRVSVSPQRRASPQRRRRASVSQAREPRESLGDGDGSQDVVDQAQVADVLSRLKARARATSMSTQAEEGFSEMTAAPLARVPGRRRGASAPPTPARGRPLVRQLSRAGASAPPSPAAAPGRLSPGKRCSVSTPPTLSGTPPQGRRARAWSISLDQGAGQPTSQMECDATADCVKEVSPRSDLPRKPDPMRVYSRVYARVRRHALQRGTDPHEAKVQASVAAAQARQELLHAEGLALQTYPPQATGAAMSIRDASPSSDLLVESPAAPMPAESPAASAAAESPEAALGATLAGEAVPEDSALQGALVTLDDLRAAVLEAKAYDEQTLQLVAGQMELAMGTPRSERHPFQHKVVHMVSVVLASEEKRSMQEVAAKKEEMADAEQKRRTVKAIAETASQTLKEKQHAKTMAEAALKSTTDEAADDKSDNLSAAEVKAAVEQAKALQAMYHGDYAALKRDSRGFSVQQLDDTLRRLGKLARDNAWNATLVEAMDQQLLRICFKELKERSNDDYALFGRIDGAFSQSIRGLAASLAAARLATEHQKSREQKAAKAGLELQDAMLQCKAHNKAVKEAKIHSLEVAKEAKTAQTSLETCRANLRGLARLAGLDLPTDADSSTVRQP